MPTLSTRAGRRPPSSAGWACPWPGSPPPTAARGRLGDHIGILPGTTATLLRTDLVGVRGKLALARFLAGVKHWRPEELTGLTIGQWLDGFHLPEDARRLVLFLVRTTTYLHDEDHVSADVAAGQIQIALGNGVEYVHGGWTTLVDALAAAARRNGAEIRTGAAVTSIPGRSPRTAPTDRGTNTGNAGGRSGAGPFTVVAGGRQIEAGAVVLAAGTPEADAALLGGRPAAWAGLGPQVEASCLDLGLRRGLAEPVLFGVDVPHVPGRPRRRGPGPRSGGRRARARAAVPGARRERARPTSCAPRWRSTPGWPASTRRWSRNSGSCAA